MNKGDRYDGRRGLQNRIQELCNERNITINKLGIICGSTESAINNIASGGNNGMTVATLKKICDGSEISIINLFNSKIFAEL